MMVWAKYDGFIDRNSDQSFVDGVNKNSPQCSRQLGPAASNHFTLFV